MNRYKCIKQYRTQYGEAFTLDRVYSANKDDIISDNHGFTYRMVDSSWKDEFFKQMNSDTDFVKNNKYASFLPPHPSCRCSMIIKSGSFFLKPADPIKKVIFSGIYTIVFIDGLKTNKTIVKKYHDDDDDKEFALLYAYVLSSYTYTKTQLKKILDKNSEGKLNTMWKGERKELKKDFLYSLFCSNTNKNKKEAIKYIDNIIKSNNGK